MIQWIKRAFRRISRNRINQQFEDTLQCTSNSTNSKSSRLRLSADSDDIQTDEVFSFKVFSAGNGKIIEFRSYDRVKDRSFNRLHIIGEDEDFAGELGKIVLFELMRS